MAIYHGKAGQIDVGSNTILHTTEWRIRQSVDTADSTVMGASWKTHTSGIPEWNGSATAFHDHGDTTGQGSIEIGDSITLNVYGEGEVATKKYYTGTATVTGIEPGGSVNGNATIAYTFTGNGALTIGTVSA